MSEAEMQRPRDVMPKLAYILLVHEPAEQVISLTRLLSQADPAGAVVVHFDANSPATDFELLKKSLEGLQGIYLVEHRVHCEWGRFGLVDAVVRALQLLRTKEVVFDNAILLSGSCMPNRPLAQFKRFLGQHPNTEFIQSYGIDWIRGGIGEERYLYHHLFNWRTHALNFERFWKLQKFLGLRRRFPAGLRPRFGSQWWCLTRQTCFQILDYIKENPRAYKFFRTTWIPDETFFQTMVAHLVEPGKISAGGMTHFEFDAKGRPIIFFDDHEDVILQLPSFFVRKVSPSANQLRLKLAEVARRPDNDLPLPSINDVIAPGLTYEERVIEQTLQPRPGQMFFGGRAYDGWPSAMRSSTQGVAVLYGPPMFTRPVANALRTSPDLDVFGRIFHPKWVDFGVGRQDGFAGLRRQDNRIRDYDPPLYLSRILERANGFPVIEISPGDDRKAESGLRALDNTIFVLCLGHSDFSGDWRTLFWILSAIEQIAARQLLLHEAPSPGDSFVAIRRRIQDCIDRVITTDHRRHMEWVTDFKNAPDRLTYLVRTGDSLVDWRATDRRIIHAIGPSARPLVASFRPAQDALELTTLDNILAPLPTLWREYFQILGEKDEPSVSPGFSGADPSAVLATFGKRQ